MGTRQTRGRRRYNPDHVQKVLQTVLMVLLVVALCIIVGRNVALNRADTQPVEPTPPRGRRHGGEHGRTRVRQPGAGHHAGAHSEPDPGAL